MQEITIKTEEPTTKPVALTVRRLRTGDVFTLLSLLADSVGTADEVKKLFRGISFGSEDNDNNQFVAVGISTVWTIIRGLLLTNQEEVTNWFASLVNMTSEEFNKLPPTAVIEIAAALKNHGDLRDFFERLSTAWLLFTSETPSQDQVQPENTSPEPLT